MTLLDPQNRLARIHPETARMVRKLVRRSGLRIYVNSGRRSCAHQRSLYAVGRTTNKGASPVTFADGCRSWHVLGRAVDLHIRDPKTDKLIYTCSEYRKLGELWESMGGKWGGRWTKFGPCGDQWHFEWHPGTEMYQICPNPDACEQLERVIDEDIATANARQRHNRLIVGAVVVLGVGAAGFYAKRRLYG